MASGTRIQPSSALAMSRDHDSVPALLTGARLGDPEVVDRLFPLVYDELRRIARRKLRGERDGHTLHTTELVHEAYVKLVDRPPADVADRAHFLAISARAMRQILVDHARRANAVKRGGAWVRTSITGKDPGAELDLDGILALDHAIESLDERQRRIVELRFFGGMEEGEIALVLGVSTRTVQRDWLKARAWIYQELYPTPG